MIPISARSFFSDTYFKTFASELFIIQATFVEKKGSIFFQIILSKTPFFLFGVGEGIPQFPNPIP